MVLRGLWGCLGVLGIVIVTMVGSAVAQSQSADMTMNGTICLDNGNIGSDSAGGLYASNRFFIRSKFVETPIVVGNGGPKGAMAGILVNGQGTVGVGNVDNMDPFSGYMQLGSVSPMILGQNYIGINAYYDNGLTSGSTAGWKYVGSQDRTAQTQQQFPAGIISTNLIGGRMWLCAADSGGNARDLIPSLKGIAISPSGALGVGFEYYTAGVPTMAGPVHDTFLLGSKIKMDINGAIAFRNIGSTNTGDPPGGYIFAEGNSMKVRDRTGDITTFSPHDDPREMFPQATTSFNDSSVDLPFTMHHENAYVGKGAYVDMTKMIKYIEKKMQSELGAQEGKLVFVYDLPAAKRKSAADYDTEVVMNQLEQMGPIKVELGADGRIPQEAINLTDEVKSVMREVEVKERKLDLEAGRVVTTVVKKKMPETIRTGRKVKKLKSGWFFKDGELYRQPTVNDLNLDQVIKKHPTLPPWVLTRMKGGQSTGQSVSSLVDEIKKRLAAVTTAAERKTQLAAIEE